MARGGEFFVAQPCNAFVTKKLGVRDDERFACEQ